MKTSERLPSYQELFGQLDFKKGVDARSVYSPAAYLADLLQLIDDTFQNPDLDVRRPDIKKIVLDDKNTFDIVPYLDIVNEILESIVAETDSVDGLGKNEITRKAYDILKKAKYPLELPFDLEHEQLSRHLKLLNIDLADLFKTFDTGYSNNYLSGGLALGISKAAIDNLFDDEKYSQPLEPFFNLKKDETLADLKQVTRFLEATGLSAEEMQALIYGSLSATAENKEGKGELSQAGLLFPNVDLGGGYFTLDDSKEQIVFHEQSSEKEGDWQKWLIRSHQIISLARATGYSIPDVELIYRQLHSYFSAGSLSRNYKLIHGLSCIKEMAKRYDLGIVEILALVGNGTAVSLGIGNSDQPEDFFNRTFNPKATSLKKQFIPGSAFIPTIFNDFTPLTPKPGSLMKEGQEELRLHLRKALGLSEKDLKRIVTRFESKATTGGDSPAYRPSILFDADTDPMSGYLLLYRIVKLSELFEISMEDFLDLLDILEESNLDPKTLGVFDRLFHLQAFPQGNQETVYYSLYARLDKVTEAIFPEAHLILLLGEIAAWARKHDFNIPDLRFILSGKRRAKEATTTKKLLKEKQVEVTSTSTVSVHDKEKINTFNSLYQKFKAVQPGAEMFVSQGTDQRTASLLARALKEHPRLVVPTHKSVLRYDRESAQAFAGDVIKQIPQVTKADFMGLGLSENLLDQLFSQLVLMRYLETDGTLVMKNFPAQPEDFVISSDMDQLGQATFYFLNHYYKEAAESGQKPVELYFSIKDMGQVEISELQKVELQKRLVYNGYLTEEGKVINPGFFSDEANLANFDLSVNFAPLAPTIHQRISEKIAAFAKAELALTTEAFATLDLTEEEREELLENLRYNDYLDQNNNIADKTGMLNLVADDLRLALPFYPYRKKIIEAIQQHILDYQSQFIRLKKESLSEMADELTANLVLQALTAGSYLPENYQLGEEQDRFFANEDNLAEFELNSYFNDHYTRVIFNRMAAIASVTSRFRFVPQSVEDLDYSAAKFSAIRNLLEKYEFIKDGYILSSSQEYFLNANNILDLDLEGYEDEGEHIFGILHQMAKAVKEWKENVSTAIKDQARKQEEVVFEQLQESLGIDLSVIKVILEEMLPGKYKTVPFLVPVLDSVNALDKITALPQNHYFIQTYRRIEQFAQLCTHLNLTAEEARAAFIDQGLVGKFPENLTLPEGWDQFDALLEFPKGPVYLFKGDRYYAFNPADYQPLASDKPLSELSKNLAGVTVVDAACVDNHGTAWLVSGDDFYYFDQSDHIWKYKEDKKLGAVVNNLTDPAEIDAALTNEDGQVFLFVGNQYVRYSDTSQFGHVDEGYPKPIEGNWAKDYGVEELPEAFHEGVDASFRDKDGHAYFFKGNEFVSSDNFAQSLPIHEHWGKPKHTYQGEAIQAAFIHKGKFILFSGPQVLVYTGHIENPNTLLEEGYPKPIRSFISGLPDLFNEGIDAALQIPDGRNFLFKDDQFVQLDSNLQVVPNSNGSVVRNIGEVWGRVNNPLESPAASVPGAEQPGLVSAALTGLDGLTYIFSGDKYFRYSGDQYGKADEGYPKKIEENWGGLKSVDAAFIMDGKTYLFGPYTETTQTPSGVTSIDKNGYVCYSTNDYDVLEKGYPKPVDDNWWNLPFELTKKAEGFAKPDAVFVGKDENTYLFSGQDYIYFERNERWWSEPKPIAEKWTGLPDDFVRVDAAFTGKDGKTYLFVGDTFLRYSDESFTKVDEGYPREIQKTWGKVSNNFQRKEVVDAAVFIKAEVPENPPAPKAEEGKEQPAGLSGTETKEVEIKMKEVEYTYLFSGNQYIRYQGRDFQFVEEGYPKSLQSLPSEPRFDQLTISLTEGFDAVCADQRTIYIFRDGQVFTSVAKPYQQYSDLPGGPILAAVMDEGKLFLENSAGWGQYTEKEVVKSEMPALLKEIPAEFQSGLDAVLQGTDGNTYFFKRDRCYNRLLEKSYPLAAEWGRPEINVLLDQGVDAILVGKDKKLYLFSGDQYQTYSLPLQNKKPEKTDNFYADGYPHSIAEDFGLPRITLAYADGEYTHLFGEADEHGIRQHLVITGDDYSAEGQRAFYETDISWWNIPAEYVEEGFDTIEAVLFEEDNMFLINKNEFLQFNKAENYWSFPKPLDRIYPGLPDPDSDFGAVRTAFSTEDGRTYFFSQEFFLTLNKEGKAEGEALPVTDYWGKIKNNIQEKGTLEAAFVYGENTYLFSGDQYVRYSGTDYEFIDPDYPKPILGHLRREPGFEHLPEAFEEVLKTLFQKENGQFDEVVSDGRNLYIFTGQDLHLFASAATEETGLNQLIRTKNNIEAGGKIDAAIYKGDDTLVLFSGDQYFVYSGKDYQQLDEGYPKSIHPHFAREMGWSAELPVAFRKGIDAAFTLQDGENERVYLFKEKEYWHSGIQDGHALPIKGSWGKVQNNFLKDNTGPDALILGLDGYMYAFSGGQYIRYTDFNNEYVDTGFPKVIRDNWGNMDPGFEEGVTGGFTFENKTYFLKGDQYIRYSDPTYRRMDPHFPQSVKSRWRSMADYWLTDIRTIAEFKALTDQFTDKSYTLTDFVSAVTGLKEQPYAALAETLGEEIEDVQWLKRNNSFLGPQDEKELRFNMESVLRIYEVFKFCSKVGHSPREVYESLWKKLFEMTNNEFPPIQPEVLETTLLYLQKVNSEADWQIIKRQLHDEMNLKKRDALLGYILAHRVGQENHYLAAVNNTRDLYGQLLIDVEMGDEAKASRVQEAIAATQLYIHRYLVHLESPNTKKEEIPARRELKSRWNWLKNYRVWEANRKVFLYPENYIRPELRDDKTPAFKKLEEDLLQGEMSEELVVRAFNNYLEEYTEVSRLTIAGGYVYDNPYSIDPINPDQELILFGRTKTDPIRYYYREATFIKGTTENATWKAWKPIEIQINATRVYPVYAFGRIFVFWATLEQTSKSSNSSVVQIESKGENKQEVRNSTETEYLLQIHFTYYDLNKQWKAPQLLKVKSADGTAGQEVSIVSYNIPIVSFKLHIENAKKLEEFDHENIEVNCEYTQEYEIFEKFSNEHPNHPGIVFPWPVFAKYKKERKTYIKTFNLTPELYVHSVADRSKSLPEITPDSHFYKVIQRVEKMNQDRLVALGYPTDFANKAWFTFDHKGGSFLVKPVVTADDSNTAKLSAKEVKDYHSKLPNSWTSIDAACQIGGTTFLFRGDKFVSSDDFSQEKTISQHWGKKPVIFSRVDTIFRYNNGLGKDSVAIFSGSQYQLLSDTKTHNLAGNRLGLPAAGPVTAAARFDGKNYFFQGRNYQVSDRLGQTRPVSQDWLAKANLGDIIGVFEYKQDVWVVGKTKFARYAKDNLQGSKAEPQATNLGNLLSALGERSTDKNLVKSISIDAEGQLIIEANELQYWRNEKLEKKYKSSSETTGFTLAGVSHQTKDPWFASNRLEQSSLTNTSLKVDKTKNWDVISLAHFTDPVSNAFYMYCGDRLAVLNAADIAAHNPPADAASESKTSFEKRTLGLRNLLRSSYSQAATQTAQCEWGGVKYLFFGDLLAVLNGNTLSSVTKLQRPVSGAFVRGNSTLELYRGDEFTSLSIAGLNAAQIAQAVNSWSNVKDVSSQWGLYEWGGSKAVTAAFTQNGKLYLVKENKYCAYSAVGQPADSGYPSGISTLNTFNNKLPASWKRIDGAFLWPLDAANPTLHLISGDQLVGDKVTTVNAWLNEQSGHESGGPKQVDAAYASSLDGIVLISNDKIFYYELTGNKQQPWTLAPDYPMVDPNATFVKAASFHDGKTYFFGGGSFSSINGFSKTVTRPSQPISSELSNMHEDFQSDFDAVLQDGASDWVFFKGNKYVVYGKTQWPGMQKSRVYDKYDIIRLTASTAAKLNTRLFAGGMDALLNRNSQEIDELPRFNAEKSDPNTIQFIGTQVKIYPISSHLDFTSANGIYYKEIFFHAPYLLAQHLNNNQKFEEAKRWFEYIYDPTEADNYWQYLPFVAVDIEALVNGILGFSEDLQGKLTADMQSRIKSITDKLSGLAPIFMGRKPLLDDSPEKQFMDDLHWISENREDSRDFNPYTVIDMLKAPEFKTDNKSMESARQSLMELLELVGPIRYRWEKLRDSPDAQLRTYLDDPFDPHALAKLRPIAYRKAIVMAYIDNLLDWGDMLFRQYTRESINEARMLYVLAYDLLGRKPNNLGMLQLAEARAYQDGTEGLHNVNSSDYDFLLGLKSIVSTTSPELSLTGQPVLSGAAASQSVMSVASNPYFYVPDNYLFLEYWERVEDRLYKIRQSLNILGVKQPLPLFEPPIDPMALVRAVAGGMPLSTAISGLSMPVPHYRFSYMLDKAKELVGQVTQFGDALLAALEKRDGEELTMLQNRQEGVILKMNRQIKQAQLKDATLNIKVLVETRNSTQIRLKHFEELIDEGFFLGEQIQMGIITAGAVLMGISAIIKTASSWPRAAPEAYIGPFIAGVSHGGSKIGGIIQAIGEGLETGGDAISMMAEIPAMIAAQQRQEMDWEMEKALALSELVQLDYQIEAALLQEQIALYEIDLLEKEIEHQEEVAKFMRDKFTNAQLYQWQAGRLSALYYQTYQLAYEAAKQAERAYQFERAVPESEVSYIQPVYWDSRRKGLLAGESLQLDLARMEQAFLQTDQRRLEILKPISLLELNPLAFLELKTKRSCEFFLNESLFAYDFPGHYCRQIKSVAITFDIQPNLHRTIFATLTQLSHHTVTEPDAKAVKFMIDPKGQPPTSIRSNWRSGQQIAISRIKEDNGVLDSYPDQERYMHFEGTGAVSRWRLEINGKPGDSLDIAGLEDVLINIEYSALNGGQAFADNVKGVLKPYPVTILLDLNHLAADNWLDFVEGVSDTLSLPVTRDLFPNMAGGKITSIYLHVDADGDKKGSIQINDDEELSLKHQHILKPTSLNVSNRGATWKISYTGDRTQLKNIGLVLGYRAKVE